MGRFKTGKMLENKYERQPEPCLDAWFGLLLILANLIWIGVGTGFFPGILRDRIEPKIKEKRNHIEYIASQKLTGQNMAVRGYDDNKDGVLDSAYKMPLGGSPRCPGWQIPIDSSSDWFAQLQGEYGNIFKNKRF